MKGEGLEAVVCTVGHLKYHLQLWPLVDEGLLNLEDFPIVRADEMHPYISHRRWL